MNNAVDRRSTFFKISFHLVPSFNLKVVGVLHPKLEKTHEKDDTNCCIVYFCMFEK